MKTVETTYENGLRHAMRDLLKSYERAFRDLDASKVISHYLDSPEFEVVNDGKALGYHEQENEVRSLFTNMTKFEGGYMDPRITVLDEHLVSATTPFRETLTFFGGSKFDVEGEVTWTAKRVGDQLKFIRGVVSWKKKPVA
jgi:hypothetical protein